MQDLPPALSYLESLRSAGVRVRTISRWLNAASVEGPPERLAELARLPFVSRLEPVRVLSRGRPLPETQRVGAGAGREAARKQNKYGANSPLYEALQIPLLHAKGLDGSGVRVLVTDTGFYLSHPVFRARPPAIVDAFDFVHNDSIVANQDGDPDGTYVSMSMCE
jgi:subtilisin family serine protease